MDDSLIGFRTDGEWSAEDLARLPRAVSQVYDALLSNDIVGFQKHLPPRAGDFQNH